jgi:hypothetical protein
MPLLLRRLRDPLALALALALAVVAMAAPAAAQRHDAGPKPDTYLCPHAAGGAVDCFLDAVSHLYTMCRQVKSIEIIEFGYEKSTEGVNGAKSEYCVDKHKVSIAQTLRSALHEARASRAAVESLRALHDLWLAALGELKWKPGESDDDYKSRVALPYETFRERATLVRSVLPADNPKAASAVATPARPKSAN